MAKRGIIIHPEELTDQMLEMLKGTKFNVLGLHPVGGVKADETLERLLEMMQTDEFQEKLDRVRALGMKIEVEAHALGWMMPRSLFETHPEWFRMTEEGKRVNDFNLCVSNKEALEYLSNRAELLAKALPSDTGMYYFWSDDVPNTICHCEKCRSLTASDQAMIIYNAMLKGIRKVDPRGKQCYLAYQATLEPPVNVKPDEGIFVEYAPIDRDTKVPLNDSGSQENAENSKVLKPLIACFGSQDAQVLEYWMDNSKFSNWTKPPKPLQINQDTVRSDIAYYKDLGFEGITSFGCYLSDDYIALYGEPPIKEYSDCFDAE